MRVKHEADYSLIVVFGIIVLFGLIMLSSASSVEGFINWQDSYWFVKHQLLFGFLPGLVLFFLFSKINYNFYKKFGALFLILSVILLTAVFIPGLGTNRNTGSTSWVVLFGKSFQPAEIVKLFMIFFLASRFTRHREKISSLAYGLLPFVIYLVIVGLLIILQPDIGTLSVILIIAIGMYYLAGAKWSHLAYIFLAAGISLWGLIQVADYRLQRLISFLDPGVDPQDIGYHINQALLAIGSGGWLGQGLGDSKQKYQYLPEVMGDSIFAVIAEELGFVVVTVFILLFLFMIYRMLKIASGIDDFYGYLVVSGVAIWFGGQFMVNVGAMLNLFPLTGLPLPLVSYGGTALMISMAAIGVVVNISKYSKFAN